MPIWVYFELSSVGSPYEIFPGIKLVKKSKNCANSKKLNSNFIYFVILLPRLYEIYYI